MLLAKVASVFSEFNESALWTVSVSGRVVGSLVLMAGEWRLSWFDDADARLRNYSGPVTGDLAELSAALSNRLGAPVSIDRC